eukprot:6136792-Prymnesium_polylepis.1
MSRYHHPTMQIGLRQARAGSAQHVPVIDVQRNVNAQALVVGDLEEVARVELGLGEALHVDDLVHDGAVRDTPRIDLT